jgi:hypothetical protein
MRKYIISAGLERNRHNSCGITSYFKIGKLGKRSVELRVRLKSLNFCPLMSYEVGSYIPTLKSLKEGILSSGFQFMSQVIGDKRS